jgi:pilus assembly protein Flp/PilA
MRLLKVFRHAGRWTTARLGVKSDRGASAVEYAIMMAMIAAVIIVAVVYLGNTTSGTFSCTAESIASHTEAC